MLVVKRGRNKDDDEDENEVLGVLQDIADEKDEEKKLEEKMKRRKSHFWMC